MDMKNSGIYEVLSPWAEADPIPLYPISPRITGLENRKIGLFANFKRAAKPMLNVVETKLKQKYPKAEFSLFDSTGINVLESETANKNRFEDWTRGVDAVVAAVGD